MPTKSTALTTSQKVNGSTGLQESVEAGRPPEGRGARATLAIEVDGLIVSVVLVRLG